MFDPDDAAKEIRIQKMFGVPMGQRKMCEHCGHPTMEYKPSAEDLHQGIEQIQEQYCTACMNKLRK